MITSVSNERIKTYMKLKQKKYRDEMQLFMVDGYHMVEEAIGYGHVVCIITTNEEYKSEYEVLYVNDRVMEKLSFTKTPQNIMAVCHMNLLDTLNEGTRYLLLDHVQDPGNIGTMLRTALAFGIDQVVLSDTCADLYNDKVLRATQGAIYKQSIVRMSMGEAIDVLKRQGVKVIATSLRNAQSIDEIQSQDKMAFVMGNEGQGLSKETIDLCDASLFIPIHGIESLNVAVAASIVMYAYRK